MDTFSVSGNVVEKLSAVSQKEIGRLPAVSLPGWHRYLSATNVAIDSAAAGQVSVCGAQEVKFIRPAIVA